ncbi:MAG: hypothetical protein J4F97_02255 [Pseudomonadales bacterium]|nr:hypothetical protein [Pseudomonadales bacterium]
MVHFSSPGRVTALLVDEAQSVEMPPGKRRIQNLSDVHRRKRPECTIVFAALAGHSRTPTLLSRALSFATAAMRSDP